MELSELTDAQLTAYHASYATMVNNRPRDESIKRFSMDTKFAYHVVRLLGEIEQILTEHDLDITRNREQLKAIRRGEWTHGQLKQWFTDTEKTLEAVYHKSDLQQRPDERIIKTLLLDCLEHHYGSLSTAIVREVPIDQLLASMQDVINQHRV